MSKSNHDFKLPLMEQVDENDELWVVTKWTHLSFFKLVRGKGRAWNRVS